MAGLDWKEFDGKSHQGLLLIGKRARGERKAVRLMPLLFATDTDERFAGLARETTERVFVIQASDHVMKFQVFEKQP